MGTQRKAEARKLLQARDPSAWVEWADGCPNALSVLWSLTFDADELVRWRAVEAIGVVAAWLAESDVEHLRAFIRRLLWSMNDESGGVGWHAPETLGEILVNAPSLVGEYGTLLLRFCRESPFEQGAHLAVCRVARVDPTPLLEGVDQLAASLEDTDPTVRGHAALALGVMRSQRHRSAVGALQTDPSPVRRYDFDAGCLQDTSVGQMAAEATGLLDAAKG